MRQSHRRGKSRRRREEGPEARPHRAARHRANERAGFWVHALSYGATLLLLLVTTRSARVMLIVATAWGIGLVLHYFVVMVVPGLRRRWIDEELGRNARPAVEADRREHTERKVRSLEDLSASIAHETRPRAAAPRFA